MTRKILASIFLLLAFSVQTFAQEGVHTVVNYPGTDILWASGFKVDGEANGEWKFYKKDGSLDVIGTYNKGVKEGVFKFYTNNVLNSKKLYSNDKLHGKVIYFDEEARAKEVLEYTEGVPSGTWKSYYTEGEHEGQVKQKVIIDMNNLDELELSEYTYNEDFDFDDFPEFQDAYLEISKIHVTPDYEKEAILDHTDVFYGGHVYSGEVTGYYANGELFFEGWQDESGFKNGEWTYYFDNGNKWLFAGYKMYDNVGLYSEYFRSGSLKEKGEFTANGNENGQWTSYYENGQIEWVRKYSEGKLDGESIQYHPNGKLRLSQNYNDGILLPGVYEEFYEDGTVEFRTEIRDNGNGFQRVGFFRNGEKKYFEGKDENGYKDGFAKYDSGKLKKEWFYQEDKKTSIVYFENGNKKLETVYVWNKPEQVWDILSQKQFDEEGNLKE